MPTFTVDPASIAQLGSTLAGIHDRMSSIRNRSVANAGRGVLGSDGLDRAATVAARAHQPITIAIDRLGADKAGNALKLAWGAPPDGSDA
jgi:hypothetical protein